MPISLDRHVPRPGVPELNRRLKWAVVAVAIAFLLLVTRLVWLQIVNGAAYLQSSTDNFVKERSLPAVRGRIVDRSGAVLADSRPAFHVTVTPRTYTSEVHDRLMGLLAIGPEEGAQLYARVQKVKPAERRRALQLLADVKADQVATIEQAKAELPGVSVEAVPHRVYPNGTLAAHLIGYMNQITEGELDARPDDGYEPTDEVGRFGLERQWESYLRGKKGLERFVVDAKGNRKAGAEHLIEGKPLEPPHPGQTLVLTIDAALQRVAERAMRNEQAGAIAVVEVSTGRIRALVSKPAFDPNVMSGMLTVADHKRLDDDPGKPFLDRTLRQHYFPGSLYKFVAAIGALETHSVDPNAEVTCHGAYSLGQRAFRCTKAHGPVDMVRAMQQSCNVYFWQLGEKVGMDRLARVAQDFGFGAPTGLGLNGDIPGRVPTRTFYEQRGGMLPGYTLNTAIGQGDVEVTVVQMALAYAAIANGGSLWVPSLVQRLEDADGAVVSEVAPRLNHKINASDASLDWVRRGLWAVVNKEKGTAYASRSLKVEVAGKTGTAQVKKLVQRGIEGWRPDQDHAWFAGYAPAARPELAVVVMVEHGGKGGHVAAPIAMQIFEAALAPAPASSPVATGTPP